MGTKCNTLFKLDVVTGKATPVALPAAPPAPPGLPPRDVHWGAHCGMHAMAVNPAGGLIATGGTATEDVVVWNVADGLRPVQTFQVGRSGEGQRPLGAAGRGPAQRGVGLGPGPGR